MEELLYYFLWPKKVKAKTWNFLRGAPNLTMDAVSLKRLRITAFTQSLTRVIHEKSHRVRDLTTANLFPSQNQFSHWVAFSSDYLALMEHV